MASALIHLAVAKKINEYLHLPEQDYYVGSIAPDLSKYLGLTKIKSHFIDSLEYRNTPNILRYLEQYKKEMKKPFEMGYFVHLYTDKIWYDTFFDKIAFNDYVETLDGELKSVNGKELQDMSYSDYSAINMYLMDKYNLDLSIFYNDIKVPESSIKELNISNIKLLLDEMGLILLRDRKRVRYLFNEEMVDKFIEDSSNEIINFLKIMGF